MRNLHFGYIILAANKESYKYVTNEVIILLHICVFLELENFFLLIQVVNFNKRNMHLIIFLCTILASLKNQNEETDTYSGMYDDPLLENCVVILPEKNLDEEILLPSIDLPYIEMTPLQLPMYKYLESGREGEKRKLNIRGDECVVPDILSDEEKTSYCEGYEVVIWKCVEIHNETDMLRDAKRRLSKSRYDSMKSCVNEYLTNIEPCDIYIHCELIGYVYHEFTSIVHQDIEWTRLMGKYFTKSDIVPCKEPNCALEKERLRRIKKSHTCQLRSHMEMVENDTANVAVGKPRISLNSEINSSTNKATVSQPIISNQYRLLVKNIASCNLYRLGRDPSMKCILMDMALVDDTIQFLLEHVIYLPCVWDSLTLTLIDDNYCLRIVRRIFLLKWMYFHNIYPRCTNDCVLKEDLTIAGIEPHTLNCVLLQLFFTFVNTKELRERLENIRQNVCARWDMPVFDALYKILNTLDNE